MHRGLIIASRITFSLVGLLLLLYIFILNLNPFGNKLLISTENELNPLRLGPPDRIKEIKDNEQSNFQLLTDFVYFTLNIRDNFEEAKVTVTFKNNNPNRQVFIGYQNEESWSYFTRMIDAPDLNELNWAYVSENPRLYQKKYKFDSYYNFLINPPKDSIIGHVDFDPDLLGSKTIPNYIPKSTNTKINVPLRGDVIFYVYVKDEPFKLDISKKDLNMYADPDIVDIKIYKDKDVVYSANIEDDGITDSTRRNVNEQSIFIQNPGPELPENGMYKVVIKAPIDTVITKIETNLNKIIFQSPLFFVSNAEVYPGIMRETQENRVFVDGESISALTYHKEAFQKITVGDKILNLDQVNKEVSLSEIPPETQASISASLSQINESSSSSTMQNPQLDNLLEIVIPKSDVVLKTQLGYFAFSRDQFFNPSYLNLFPVSKNEDLAKVDYLITNYVKPISQGDWKVAEINFNLNDAYIDNGRLSWIIKVPGLKEGGETVIVKNVNIELLNKPKINPESIPPFIRCILIKC